MNELRVLRAGVDAVDAQEWHLAKLQQLEDLRRVREVTRDARHVLGDDHLDPPRVHGNHHRLEPGAIQAGSGHREIGEHLRILRVAALLRDELAATAHLIFNAAFVLQL